MTEFDGSFEQDGIVYFYIVFRGCIEVYDKNAHLLLTIHFDHHTECMWGKIYGGECFDVPYFEFVQNGELLSLALAQWSICNL